MFLPKSGPPWLLQSHDQYPHTSGVLKWSPKPTIMPPDGAVSCHGRSRKLGLKYLVLSQWDLNKMVIMLLMIFANVISVMEIVLFGLKFH